MWKCINTPRLPATLCCFQRPNQCFPGIHLRNLLVSEMPSVPLCWLHLPFTSQAISVLWHHFRKREEQNTIRKADSPSFLLLLQLHAPPTRVLRWCPRDPCEPLPSLEGAPSPLPGVDKGCGQALCPSFAGLFVFALPRLGQRWGFPQRRQAFGSASSPSRFMTSRCNKMHSGVT